MSGYRVEVVREGDRNVIGAYINDEMVAAAYEPDLPTGMWRIAVHGWDLPVVNVRDKDAAVMWLSFLAAGRR